MDSDDEEYEQFQVTDEDMMGFPKRRRRFTKEDHIYGMWAQHDSDEEKSSRGRKKDFSRPLSFVSAGVEGGAEGDEDDRDSDPDDQDLDEEAKNILEGLEQEKLTETGEKVGIGSFQFASLTKNKQLGAFQTTPDSATPTGSKPKGAAVTANRFQSSRRMDRDFGKWEKHGTGFGSKMLQKMGWTKGTGLGAKGEGIVNPVKAKKHTDFGSGMPDPDVVGVGRAGGGTVVEGEDEEDEEEQRKFEEQLQQWRKTESSGKAKPKYVYKTVEELKLSGQRYRSKQKTHTAVKVIDLTGPQRRELSSYEEIHDRHSRPDDVPTTTESQKVFLPELLHNIQLLVDRTESEILQSDRRLQYNQDLIVNLRHEREGLHDEIEIEENQINKLSEILNTVEICEQRLSSKDTPPLSLQECQELMTSLQDKYPQEYKLYDLSSVAVALIFPLLRSFLQNWEMLKSPHLPISVFSTWRGLLRESESALTVPPSDKMDPYDRLVWEIWMPKLRSTLSHWSSRQCAPVVDLLEAWMPLLPTWIMNNILDQLVLPRLQSEVETWDPTTDPYPIHAWVHPWLPLMEYRLEVLYAPIRYKLAIALNSWHPSDASAHKILEPWVKVFSPETMEMFVVRTILPKLIYCIQSLPINPHQQEIAPFEWVMAWRDMLPIHHYVNMLDKHFFPKWLQVLQSWLTSGPNFEEVTKWYSGWKGMLDHEILGDPIIKRHFNHALDMMNHAVAGTLQPGVRENMAYFTSTERRRAAVEGSSVDLQRGRGVSLHNAISAPATLSFKDVIERMAEDNGLLFMPAPGQRRYEGKALYTFGNVTIYIDRGVVFTFRGGNWSPVSLDQLLRLGQ